LLVGLHRRPFVFLNRTEIDALDLQIARVHAATGVRVVAAEIGKADTYEDLPWKAFALGLTFAALLVVEVGVQIPQWQTPLSTMLSAVIMLAAGALAALLAIFIPSFGRLFLHGAQCEREIGQYAQALFLRRELFKTPHRNAVLILVSRFERRVHILADTGLRRSIEDAEWQAVIERMKPALRDARTLDALQTGLAVVEEVLLRAGYRGIAGAHGEPTDPLIEEKGA
jgi:putative membrane protein